MSEQVRECHKIHALEDLEDWCRQVDQGGAREFFISGEISQETATELAWEINQDRVGHVWITVKEVVYTPDPSVTHISVRCTE